MANCLLNANSAHMAHFRWRRAAGCELECACAPGREQLIDMSPF